jgi:hypothetical protein
MKLKTIGLIIFLILSNICLFYILRLEKQKSERLYNNVDALIKGNKHERDSLIVSNKIIRLELSEVKELYPELKKQLKDVDIRLKDVQAYQKTLLEINAKFTAKIYEKTDTTLLSKYTDKYLKYLSKLNLKDSSENVEIYMPVDLQQAAYNKRVPGFWNWVRNKRELTQKIWTDNPYVLLNYNETIEIKK